MRWRFFGVLIFVTHLTLVTHGAENEPHVEMFSPTGLVKNVRQVAVSFSDGMIPLGDPQIFKTPFDIDCAVKGNGRWVDTTHWVYDFETDVPGGTRCEFKLKLESETLSGRQLAGAKTFIFSTGGPAVMRSKPHEGSEQIVEEQTFLLTLDSPATAESILEHVYFQIDGVNEPVGAKIVSPELRKEILSARKSYERKEKEENLVILQAKQKFPQDVKVSLVWGRGVLSPAGVGTDADQVLNFKVRGPFLIDFSCQRENLDSGCNPFTSMSVNLSADVSSADAQKIQLKDLQGKIYQSARTDSEISEWVSSVRFEGPFPEKTEFILSVPPSLEDESGRSAVNISRFPLAVKTEAYPPLAKFSGTFGILESKGDALLPVTLRRIEPEIKAALMKGKKNPGVRLPVEIEKEAVTGKVHKVTENGNDVLYWLNRVEEAKRETSIFDGFGKRLLLDGFTLPARSQTETTEVVGIPFREPGFYVVELESVALGTALLGKPARMFVPTAVLVTNMAVHFKWGRENSLVWVTQLDDGKPAAGSQITVRDCNGKSLYKGITDVKGLLKIDKLPGRNEIEHCSTDHTLDSGVFVESALGNDFSFVHSSWDKGIESWRFQVPTDYYESQTTLAHTIFARTLLKAGETVHMKHIIRKHVLNGFAFVPSVRWPKAALIEHAGSEQSYKVPLKWAPDGSAETVWKIPDGAKLGTYSVSLLETPEKSYGINSGSFRVEEFRVPLMKATLLTPKLPLVRANEATLDISVNYLMGGGAPNLPIKLRAHSQPRLSVTFDDFDGFEFSSQPVVEGRKKQGDSATDGDRDLTDGGSPNAPFQTQNLTLDKNGSVIAKLKDLPTAKRPLDLLTEIEFRDPNGEIQTASNRIALWPSNYLVGIKPDSWAVSKDNLKAQVAVVTLAGKPVEDAPVTVEMFERKTFSHRKRIVGGFYGYEHWDETKKIGKLCEGKTNVLGIFYCEGLSSVSGNVILQAVSSDGEKQEVSSNREVWVAGQGDWWFEIQDTDRMDLIAAKKNYAPGEVASLQVRMPFRSATALVTVEREGIIDATVQELSGKSPIVEIPIKGSYSPNVFVSVMAVRGRASEPLPTAMVDLGRPAYKLGLAEISVGWAAHELKVQLKPEREVYRVREKALVKIKVTSGDGSVPAKGSEVAVAAVDEGLLELMPNESWNLLEQMMGRRSYEVQTASAQMFIVGKRHFGVKGIPVGGGGGKQTTRELFDTLLFWKSHVALNERGEASISIPLNDSVTRFKVVAVATGGSDFFGTGSASVRSTQDLVVLAGIPPVVRESDIVDNSFSVRNTTDHSMTVEIFGSTANENNRRELPSFPKQTMALAAGDTREIYWKLTIPENTKKLSYSIRAREMGGSAADTVKISQKVVPLTPTRTYQATLLNLDKSVLLPVAKPIDAVAGRGGVRVAVSSSLVAGALAGVHDFMAQYPYDCLEQKVSRAIATGDLMALKKVGEQLPTFLDSDGLVKYFPSLTEGSDTLTAYLLSISDEAGWLLPEDSKNKMLSGLKRVVNGSLKRVPRLMTADLTLRKLSALEAISRYEPDANVLSALNAQPNLWPTSAVLDWMNLLQRLSDLPEREVLLSEAGKILRARLTFSGTQLSFSTESSDALWWLMVSEDVNAVKTILTVRNLPDWSSDMPRLVQGALGRQKHGAWDLTTANAWGALAVQKFSDQFEKNAVVGVTSINLGDQRKKVVWKQVKVDNSGAKSDRVLFPWPTSPTDLALSHTGKGLPWLFIQTLAAIPLTNPLYAGYRLTKTVTPVERKVPEKWSRGDVLKIKLEISAVTDFTWVVLEDPIPAGSSILGSGLGNDSQLNNPSELANRGLWPVFQERTFESFKSYYDFMPKGKWTAEYTLRINNAGMFHLPSSRIQAMYSPENFAEIPNSSIEILP